MRIANWLSVISLSAAAFSFSEPVRALEPEDDPDYKGKSAESDENKTTNADKDKSGADIKEDDENKKTLDPGDIERAREAEKANTPIEDPKTTYYFVGVRYRAHIVPQFMINLFGDGGTTVWANGVGPEVTIRKNDFEYVFSAWWTKYAFDWTPFKGKSDVAQAWELVKSNIQVLYFTSDFNWTHQISPVFGLNLGIGAGIGVVWGDLHRVEAYPNGQGGYLPCAGYGVSDPNNNVYRAYCISTTNHFGNYTEASWANGGQKPLFFPWFGLGTGMRFKPHRNFMMRVDLGWGLIGPYFGVSGNYGI